MNLSVLDRVLLPSLLPKRGRRIEMIICQSVLQLIEFSAEEVAEFELKDAENGAVVWKPSMAKDKEVCFSAEQLEVIKKGINEADMNGEISLQMLPLCDKF